MPLDARKPMTQRRAQVKPDEPYTVAAIEADLMFVARLCELRPEATAIFDRLEEELALARARESNDPITRMRAMRAAQRAGAEGATPS